ncbi:MAG TPA: peptidase MA family metallohydrolase [Candidatus Saccharimonadales bacterium]|jgi:tetratricopeptide (TPR) repeat protein|nr:peptidase MA family metallohydrolase [Candidatus Saccharimonadales bacterium]
MRSPAAHLTKFFALLCLALAASGSVFADTIYLKSGRKISATHVTQENGEVSYETSAGRLSFPLSIVDHVTHDDSSPISTAGTPRDRAANLPMAAPAEMSAMPTDPAASAAVRDGAINTDLLSKLESEASSNPSTPVTARVVAAESAAARFEISVGDFEHAVDHYNVGLRFDPDNMGLLLEAAYLHLKRSEYTAASDLLDHARRIDPDSAEVAKLSGWAYYGLNRAADAVTQWRRAMELQPDDETKKALEKAERDAREEAEYHEGETTHFRLKYNGNAAPELAHDVLKTLEAQFDEISATLNYSPPEPIGVILYTNQAFMDITRAPSWSGALNDGRIRVPVSGLSSMTDELARVLKHELTHSFVGQKTGGRCPVWLQEGLAQFMEGRRSRNNAVALSAAFEHHMEFSLLSYESSWLNLPKDTATVAYAWSLAVVETIMTENGVDDMERILERIAGGSSTEDAIRSVVHEDYSELMLSTAQFLRKAYE